MKDSYDVAIVGGGVMGSAIAYFLAAEPAFDGSILVVEKDPTYARSSTALSVASIRQQFSVPENIRISQFGFSFFESVATHLFVDGQAPDVGLKKSGYLFLASAKGRAVLERKHRTQKEHDADVVLLEPDQVKARFPWINVDGVAGASLGLSGEGWLDSFALLQAFKAKARSLGVTYIKDRVTGLERQGNRMSGVELEKGGKVACGAVINAAGPVAADVAALAGIKLPVRPRKRFVFVFRCRTAIPDCPMVIDPSGLYFRPEGNGFLTGISPPPEEDRDCQGSEEDFEVDHGLFERRLWPILAGRVPAFEAIRQDRAWAGLYAYNTVDQNAVLGPHPQVANFIFANGFSGHGLQQAPGVGRAIGEIVTFGEYRTLDLARLGFARFAAGRPVRELNII